LPCCCFAFFCFFSCHPSPKAADLLLQLRLPLLLPFTIIQTALKPPFKPIAALLFTLLTAAQAQQPTPRTVIFLDPAHGGSDPGAHLPNNLLEKDLNLAFATRLRAQLAAAGFTLLSTRDADPAVPFSTDQRAEIANHAHPFACLILHATSSGSGVHVITSSLAPNELDDPHATIPWNTAQSSSIPQSLALANEIGLALERAKIPVILSRASLRPLDNLLCPAVAIEIAPLTPSDADVTPVSNANYQQTVAKAIVAALSSWRTHTLAAAGVSR
jgi:N-acetylmuramoyl-L-alanine amidase